MTTEHGYVRLEQLSTDDVSELYLRALARISGGLKPGQFPFSEWWQAESRYIPVLAKRPDTDGYFERTEEVRKNAEQQLKSGNFIGMLDYHLQRTTEIHIPELRKRVAAIVLYYVGTPLFFSQDDQGGITPVDDYLQQIDDLLAEFREPTTARQFLLRNIILLNRSVVGEKQDLMNKKNKQFFLSIKDLIESLADVNEWTVVRLSTQEINLIQALVEIMEGNWKMVGSALGDAKIVNHLSSFMKEMLSSGHNSVLFLPAITQIVTIRKKYGPEDWRLVAFGGAFKEWVESGEASDTSSRSEAEKESDDDIEDTPKDKEVDEKFPDLPMPAGLEKESILGKKLLDLAYQLANPDAMEYELDTDQLREEWETLWQEIMVKP